MTRWKTASDKDDKSKGGIWFGNRYAGSDAGAKADIKSYETFQTQLGLMQTRMGEIGGEFDQREDFMSKQNFLENAGVNRDAMFNIGNAQNQEGSTGFASSGGAEQNTERTRAGFVDTLRGNAMSFAKDRFELGLQEKAETLGMQTNMLDLYANYQANRQNLEFDATDDFDINQAAGLT